MIHSNQILPIARSLSSKSNRMEAEACEIARLPEELLSAALSRTSPRVACRAAAASPAFRVAADSDAVWARFLPRDLPPLADGELLLTPPTRKKDLFLRLSDHGSPLLLPDKLASMWLDRETGAKCYMLSARSLTIIWGDTPQYWTWIPLADSSRFSEGAQLLRVCWLDISGRIPCKMLSLDTVYAAYLVFKANENSFGLDYPVQDASVSVGATSSTRMVCLQSNDEEDEDGDEDGAVPGHYWPVRPHPPLRTGRRTRRSVPHADNVGRPQERADGWMELELGEFFNDGGGDDDGEVSFSLVETNGGRWKSGLVVQGIEIRRKKSG
ncbi:F-box protein PP2-B10-like [Lolium perenne]|uniref:F-box protein PP2-B10-like n=1 Tax=Lolium perenne TaxID=4522 RepID=UPI0021F66A98|nr:F-box protein PP2-B10-like [Lolium perenne]